MISSDAMGMVGDGALPGAMTLLSSQLEAPTSTRHRSSHDRHQKRRSGRRRHDDSRDSHRHERQGRDESAASPQEHRGRRRGDSSRHRRHKSQPLLALRQPSPAMLVGRVADRYVFFTPQVPGAPFLPAGVTAAADSGPMPMRGASPPAFAAANGVGVEYAGTRSATRAFSPPTRPGSGRRRTTSATLPFAVIGRPATHFDAGVQLMASRAPVQLVDARRLAVPCTPDPCVGDGKIAGVNPIQRWARSPHHDLT
jgi:hypothetical protein